MSTRLTGGCLCGGTRYELTAVPFDVGDCHCVDCRRAAGAPFVTWGTVYRGDFRITQGEVRRVAHANRFRSFAACCGTPLVFEESSEPPAIDVTIASLDDPTPFAPERVIWLEDRLPWVVLDPALPQYRRSSRDG
ncbi:GFA family protein [Opitutus terrae]|uniref:Glutathione-dependent formaldehyde-activating GFA n=1 Tax=Opitutus terrae (strain DSM 11246 / JCM 15787 / PB90-1) TaxID=452637 RepID=B1ZZJ8_OPITP|nr:GFA family protein [Opitutus terrae]ACB76401.1 glutathione-dependent formaldehyde-activating GFA [Opitutus terrae PB90-1]